MDDYDLRVDAFRMECLCVPGYTGNVNVPKVWCDLGIKTKRLWRSKYFYRVGGVK